MDHEPQVHQPVPDDRVRDEGDEDHGEQRTYPAIAGAPCQKRDEKVHGDSACPTD